MKYRQAWTRLSAIFCRFTRFSCSRYESKRDSMFSTIGFQLRDTIKMGASREGLMTAPILVVDEVSETRCVYDSQA